MITLIYRILWFIYTYIKIKWVAQLSILIEDETPPLPLLYIGVEEMKKEIMVIGIIGITKTWLYTVVNGINSEIGLSKQVWIIIIWYNSW